jgi:hypothetical protein
LRRRRRWRWRPAPPAAIPPSATSVAITEDGDDASVELGAVELAHCVFEIIVAAKLNHSARRTARKGASAQGGEVARHGADLKRNHVKGDRHCLGGGDRGKGRQGTLFRDGA